MALTWTDRLMAEAMERRAASQVDDLEPGSGPKHAAKPRTHCIVPGCTSFARYSSGHCHTHYLRHRRGLLSPTPKSLASAS